MKSKSTLTRSIGRISLYSLLATSVVLSSSSVLNASNASPIYGSGENWTTHGGTSDEGNYSRLDSINRANIGKLGLVWSLDLEDERTLEATPLAVNGVLYFTGSYGNIYAVNGETGKLLWKFDTDVSGHNPDKMRYVLPVNRGVAYADGKVFVGTLDGRLIAVDAKTGKEVWSTPTTTRESKHTITGAPVAFGGKVIIGNGGADFGARGYVTAYDQQTGKQVWRFYTVPGSPEQSKGDPAMERAAATWAGEYWKTGTGGGAWNEMTFDRQLNRIYIGTGNAAPIDPAVPGLEEGDDLYTAAIVAIDADTGKYVWHYQLNPHDSWDYDSTQQMTLAELKIAGKPRKVLMQAPKNGFLYVIDRNDGRLISAGKIGKVNWADHIDVKTGRPVEVKNAHYESGQATIWPGPMGAHNWQAMSFDPRAQMLYIPYMQLGLQFIKRPDVPGGLVMEPAIKDPEDGKGALLAYDPVAQKAKWKVPHPFMWNGGTLATAGGLVFQGTADGFISAYEAKAGKRLWKFNAGLGIIAPPMSYSVHGKQYVSVLVGYGTTNVLGSAMNIGWKYGAQPRRLLTFALNGNAKITPSSPRSMVVHPLDDPTLKISFEDAKAGQSIFGGNCASCHGRDAVSAGAPAPDLRESPIALQADSLWQVVNGGALEKRGMPPFTDLTREQVNQIHAFIRARARAALGTGPRLPAATGGSHF